MRSRVDTMSTLAFAGKLSVHSEIRDGAVRYLGSINGKEYVSGPTYEMAIQSLLRRISQHAPQ